MCNIGFGDSIATVVQYAYPATTFDICFQISSNFRCINPFMRIISQNIDYYYIQDPYKYLSVSYHKNSVFQTAFPNSVCATVVNDPCGEFECGSGNLANLILYPNEIHHLSLAHASGVNRTCITQTNITVSMNVTITLTCPPTLTPTHSTNNPTTSPSIIPTLSPTNTPSISPSYNPTRSPSDTPTISPSKVPTINPSSAPSISITPTLSPSISPSNIPSTSPTVIPTLSPTNTPSILPTRSPSILPLLTAKSGGLITSKKETLIIVIIILSAALVCVIFCFSVISAYKIAKYKFTIKTMSSLITIQNNQSNEPNQTAFESPPTLTAEQSM